jgi:hypothetical protein
VADIAVGAYKSGHAIVLRARPVITYQATIAPYVSSIGFNTASFKFSACITYKGKDVPSTVGKFVHDGSFLRKFFVCLTTHKNIFVQDVRMDLLFFIFHNFMY